MKPIKCLVYKPACEFWNELLNFGTNFQTSQRISEYYSEKLSEIDDEDPSLRIESFAVINLYVVFPQS